MLPLVLERLRLIRTDAFTERRAPTMAAMVLLSFAGACATGLLAQVRLPMWPVPVTGQVLAVLVCGALLGVEYGALSQATYAALGIAGFPWFAGGASGWAALAGPSGGYILGFVVAAFFIGAVTRQFRAARGFTGQVFIMLAGVAIIYLFGVAQLMSVLQVGLGQGWDDGVKLFVIGDVIKVVIAAALTSAVLPRE